MIENLSNDLSNSSLKIKQPSSSQNPKLLIKKTVYLKNCVF